MFEQDARYAALMQSIAAYPKMDTKLGSELVRQHATKQSVQLCLSALSPEEGAQWLAQAVLWSGVKA